MAVSKRLDIILVERGLFNSRSKAQAAIMAGDVLVMDQVVTKCGYLLNGLETISIKNDGMKYVGRGGEKMEAAIKEFKIDVNNKIAIDIGASTGGFSQCLVKHGAKLVIAIDVGHNQLSPKLISEPRIVSLEGVNARYLTLKMLKNLLREKRPGKVGADIADKIDLAVIDVSFISILKIIPSILNLTVPEAKIIALVKPQFEATKKEVIKGIIKDSKLHDKIVNNTKEALKEIGLDIMRVIPSPILGAKGNKEYLFHMRKKSNE